MKKWTVQITDQTACSVQSDLDLHCPQKASCIVISRETVKIKLCYKPLVSFITQTLHFHLLMDTKNDF